jgi:N-acetylmuramoyl-L-alanine amidase
VNLTEQLLPLNPYSRPGRPRTQLLALIMHWTAKPGQRAAQTAAFYESLAAGRPRSSDGSHIYGSAHYIVDLDGSILRVLPEAEVAYHVGTDQVDPVSGRVYTDWARAHFGLYALDPRNVSPNSCTLGIEMCVQADGEFSLPTLSAAMELAANICARYRLRPLADIARHYDVVGWKRCPEPWVRDVNEFYAFRANVEARM